MGNTGVDDHHADLGRDRARFDLQRAAVDAHRLPGLQPVLRLCPLAVDPKLAFPNDPLDMGKA